MDAVLGWSTWPCIICSEMMHIFSYECSAGAQKHYLRCRMQFGSTNKKCSKRKNIYFTLPFRTRRLRTFSTEYSSSFDSAFVFDMMIFVFFFSTFYNKVNKFFCEIKKKQLFSYFHYVQLLYLSVLWAIMQIYYEIKYFHNCIRLYASKPRYIDRYSHKNSLFMFNS